MDRIAPPTGYARLTPLQARGALIVLVLASLFLLGISLSPLANRGVSREKQHSKGDVALYRAIVDGVHNGEGYYPATRREQRSRHYPTGSPFNWRFPLPFWLIGWMPAVLLGKALLGLLALGLILLAFEALARDEDNNIRRPLACVLLLTGPLLFCILGDIFVMPVIWAGVLIALSICAYGVERPAWGVAFGLSAVFVRELAMPYCVVAVALAVCYRRRGELAAWLGGLGVWAGLFALHCLKVHTLITPDDLVHHQGWIRLGGAPFVIATAQINAYLLILPQWLTALYLAAALFGFAGWHTRLGLRCGLTACLFVVTFAVVGQEFNQYWGALTAPLLCFGVARFPASLKDAWQAARKPLAGAPRTAAA